MIKDKGYVVSRGVVSGRYIWWGGQHPNSHQSSLNFMPSRTSLLKGRKADISCIVVLA